VAGGGRQKQTRETKGKRFGFGEKLATHRMRRTEREIENGPGGKKEKEIPLQVCTGTLKSVISFEDKLFTDIAHISSAFILK
jgi:hypothetical protein